MDHQFDLMSIVISTIVILAYKECYVLIHGL